MAAAGLASGSLGRLGSCPFAPGAHGNMDTAELVEHCAARGIDTGVDTSALPAALTALRAALDRGSVVPARG